MSEIVYDDLPAWAQPGATAVVYHIGSATVVTVERVTKTQIVGRTRYAELRFERKPQEIGPYSVRDFQGPQFKQRGTYSTYLVSPDEPRARKALLHEAVKLAVSNAEGSVDKQVMARRKPDRNDKRSLVEKALHEVDMIENAARLARKAIMEAVGKYGEPEAAEKESTDAD